MLVFRDKLRNLYAEYDLYILPVIKYALALFTFITINRTLGYMEALNNVVLILILSAACAILPWNAIPVIGIIMVVLHCFGLGLEVGACAIALYMILLIFYFRFVPGDGLALTLTIATSSIGYPGIVPIGLGLMKGPVSALTAVCSMVSWMFVLLVKEVVAPLKYSPETSLLDTVKAIIEGMLNNKLLLVYAITFAAVVLLVSLIRKSGVSWSWEIAIVVGGIVQIALYAVLCNIMAIETELVTFLIGSVVAVAVSFVLAFFVYNVDYKGAERLQFEDDQYVYYVKAIPKKTSGYQNAASSAEDADEEE